MSPTAPPTSTNEALEILTSAMSYLASADPTQMVIEEQARCLATIEEVDAVRASVLGGSLPRRATATTRSLRRLLVVVGEFDAQGLGDYEGDS